METVKSAAILLSRQKLRPSLQDEWVRNLKKAVEFVKSEGWTLCSSVATANWEIITAGASIESVPVKLFIPIDYELTTNKLLKDFGLDVSTAQFINVGRDNRPLTPEELWKNRDHTVVSAAEILIPVSIRPGGNMSELVSVAKGAGKNVNCDFQVRYEKAAAKLSYTIDETRLSDEIRSIGDDYVIHWTRSSNGPWPNEKKLDYYSSVLNSTAYPRNGLNTLQRIMSTKQIIASSKNMPGKIPTVSFSGLAATETIKLMRWRPRYRQMSFEPYGIGVAKKSALSMGIKQVRYYDARADGAPKGGPPWLTQSGGKITDWRNEEEYRHKGDFDLSAVANDRLIAIFYRTAEAKEFRNRLKIKSVSFCD